MTRLRKVYKDSLRRRGVDRGSIIVGPRALVQRLCVFGERRVKEAAAVSGNSHFEGPILERVRVWRLAFSTGG